MLEQILPVWWTETFFCIVNAWMLLTLVSAFLINMLLFKMGLHYGWHFWSIPMFVMGETVRLGWKPLLMLVQIGVCEAHSNHVTGVWIRWQMIWIIILTKAFVDHHFWGHKFLVSLLLVTLGWSDPFLGSRTSFAFPSFGDIATLTPKGLLIYYCTLFTLGGITTYTSLRRTLSLEYMNMMFIFCLSSLIVCISIPTLIIHVWVILYKGFWAL